MGSYHGHSIVVTISIPRFLTFPHFHHLFPISYLNGHDSCYDGHTDANLPTVAMKLNKRLRFEEKLSDDEVSASFYLLLQMLQVFLVTGAVRMAMWVACTCM